MLSLTLLLAFSGLKIDLDEGRFYNPSSLSLFQFGSGYLLCSYAEAALALFDEKGALVKRYGKKGEGPREILMPTVIGLRQDRFIVLSNHRKLLVFDKDLKPDPTAYPPLSPNLSRHLFIGGFALDETALLLYHSGLSAINKNLVTGVKLTDGQWRATDGYLPQTDLTKETLPRSLLLARNLALRPRGPYLFLHRNAILRDEDYYEVNMHQRSSESAMALTGVFLADLSQVAPFDHDTLCYPEDVLCDDRQVIVRLKNTREQEWLYDFFDHDGTFRRRVASNTLLIPCQNAKKIFKIVEDAKQNEYITPFDGKL